jgi:hypothetical protein
VSFDTSSATAMSLMFYVRSAARALPPHSPPAGPFACAACARRCRTRAPGLGIGRAPRALWSPRSALSPPVCRCVVLCACAPLAPGPPPHTLTPRPSSPAPSGPHTHTPRPASLTPCFRLGRKRRPSISGRGSTCPAPRTWDSCSQCAPPRAYALPPEPSSHAGPPRSRRLCCRVPPALPPLSRAPPAHLAPRTSHAPLSTWQGSSLSAANRLLIRCAWAGTPAFDNALPPYDEIWAPGSCL